MNWYYAIAGYMVFGVLLMTYMCPCWHPLEWLIGAVIWPIAAGIGIYMMIQEAGRDNSGRGVDLETTLMIMHLVIAIEAAKVEVAKATAPKKEDHRWN